MKLTKIVISELIVVLASVLIFRSLWIMLDKHFGDAYLEIMLIIGIIIVFLGSLLLHHEIKCEIEKL